MARDAVRSILNRLWNVLEPLGYPIALMGGLALAVWYHPRSTRDVDLLLGIGRENIGDVLDRLKAIGCRAKKHPPLHIVGDHSFVQLLYTPPGEFYDVQFDLLLAESDLQKAALRRCVTRPVEGVEKPIQVLSCEDLILFKLLAGRMIDLADAAMLLRENFADLDTSYLANWIKQLELGRSFGEVWHEAFPDQALPVEIV
jgi:hypothetical protein